MKTCKLIRLTSLLLCLVLTGCGGTAGDPVPGNKPNDGATMIVAPVDTETPHFYYDTRSETEKTPVTTAPAPQTTLPEETTADTAPVIDTPPITDTAETTGPAETTAPPAPETTAAPEIVIPVSPDDILIGDKLAIDHPVSGTLVSKEAKKMSLEVDYTATMAIDGSVTLDFSVGLRCFDITCGARVDMGHLKINSTEHVFSTPALDRKSSSATVIPFTKFSYRLPAGQTSCRIEADWQFYGNYGGEYIKLLTVGAVLRWDEPEEEAAETKGLAVN